MIGNPGPELDPPSIVNPVDYKNLKHKCKDCKRKIPKGNLCASCKQERFDKKVDKQAKRELEKLRNTVEYGISRVHDAADQRYWSTSHKNCFRITWGKGESLKHIVAKFIRYLHHRKHRRTVFTELVLKNNRGRVDLLVVTGSFIFIEEIIVSEKEKSIIQKRKKYPFPVNIIDAKDLNIMDFMKNVSRE